MCQAHHKTRGAHFRETVEHCVCYKAVADSIIDFTVIACVQFVAKTEFTHQSALQLLKVSLPAVNGTSE